MGDHVKFFPGHSGGAFPVDDTSDLVVRRVDEYIGLIQVGMCYKELARVGIDQFRDGFLQFGMKPLISCNVLRGVPVVRAVNVYVVILPVGGRICLG